MNASILAACSLLVLVPSLVGAEAVYKCTDEKGRVTFSGTPCGANEEIRELPSSTQSGGAVPDSGLRQGEIQMLKDAKAREKQKRLAEYLRAEMAARRAEEARRQADLDDLSSQLQDLKSQMYRTPPVVSTPAPMQFAPPMRCRPIPLTNQMRCN